MRNIVHAAGRADGNRGVGRSAAKLVSAIGTDPKHAVVAIAADLAAGFQGMLAAYPLKALANLKQVAVNALSPNRRRR